MTVHFLMDGRCPTARPDEPGLVAAWRADRVLFVTDAEHRLTAAMMPVQLPPVLSVRDNGAAWSQPSASTETGILFRL